MLQDWLSIASMLANLASLKPNSELNIILDSRRTFTKAQVIKKLNELKVSLSLYDIETLQKRQNEFLPEECPLFDILPKNPIPSNQMADRLIPARRYHRSLFIWTQSMDGLETIYTILNNTVQDCNLAVDPGLFHDNTRFYFFVGNHLDLAFQLFEGRERLRRHPNVAVITQSKGTNDNFKAIFVHNALYAERTSKILIKLSHLWKPSNNIPSLNQAFANHNDLLGTTLIISTSPYPPFAFGDEVNIDPTHIFANYWGFEALLLETISCHLNFIIDWQNPVDLYIVAIENGSYVGFVRDIVDGKVDFTFVYTYYSLSKAGKNSVPHFWDFLTLCSPKARTQPRAMAFLDPFSLWVWIIFIVSIFVISPFVYVVAKLQERISQREPWSTSLQDIFWLIMQYILSQKDLVRRINGDAMRCVLIMWLFFCFIMSNVYNGQIKGFLTLPITKPEIDDFSAVLKRFGTLEEHIMATSSDPIVSAIWDRQADRVKLYNTYGYGYSDFDMEAFMFEVQLVYDHQYVVIDWYSFLVGVIRSRFSTPDGHQLVHLGKKPVLNRQSTIVWFVNAFAPWLKALDKATRRIVESGMIDKFLEDTYQQMRQAEISKGFNLIEQYERPNVSPMILSDYLSTTIIYCIPMTVAIVSFIVEVCSSRTQKDIRHCHDMAEKRVTNIIQWNNVKGNDF